VIFYAGNIRFTLHIHKDQQATVITPRPRTHLPHVPIRCSTATITPQPPTLTGDN
jgi:hypothetical protein